MPVLTDPVCVDTASGADAVGPTSFPVIGLGPHQEGLSRALGTVVEASDSSFLQSTAKSDLGWPTRHKNKKRGTTLQKTKTQQDFLHNFTQFRTTIHNFTQL